MELRQLGHLECRRAMYGCRQRRECSTDPDMIYDAPLNTCRQCLPSLRPLFTTLLRGTPSIRNRSIATNSTTSSEPWKPFYRSRNKSRDNSEGGGGGHFKRLDDPFAKHSRWHRDVTVRGGKDIERGSGDDVSLQEVNVPFGQIRVKDEVVITSTDWLEYKDRVY